MYCGATGSKGRFPPCLASNRSKSFWTDKTFQHKESFNTASCLQNRLEMWLGLCHCREVVCWPNDQGNAAATDTPATVEDQTAARVHPLVRPFLPELAASRFDFCACGPVSLQTTDLRPLTRGRNRVLIPAQEEIPNASHFPGHGQ